MKKSLMLFLAVSMIIMFAYNVGASTSVRVNENVIFDATTSELPTPTPGCYIYTGYNSNWATPRSIQTYWPISELIDSSTQGTSTFSFFAKSLSPNSAATIYINGQDAGQVQTTVNYSWVTINFPTSYLDQGINNIIEIWANTTALVAVACGASKFDDVGEKNAISIRNNGGSASDSALFYGEIYAKTEVHIQKNQVNNLSDSNKLFDCVEKKYPEIFSSEGTDTFPLLQYLVRYYVDNDTYIGTEGSDVYVYGKIFGGLLYVGQMNDLIQEICPVIAPAPNFLGTYTGSATNIVYNCTTSINNRTTISSGTIEVTSILDDGTFSSLGRFSTTVSGYFIEERFDLLGLISPGGELTGRANSSALLDGDPIGSGTSMFAGQISGNEITIKFPEQALGVDNCISSGTSIKAVK